MTHFGPDETDYMRNPSADPSDEAFPPRFATDDDGGFLEVDLGQQLPPSQVRDAAVFNTVETNDETAKVASEYPHSMLADGLFFTGHGLLKGPCSVACNIKGDLVAADGHSVAVVITETGVVDGDITAEKIAVMGHTNGVLDSGMGDVVLYESASVQGLVRYGRIQVNGADLNATLERMVRK